MAEKQYEVLWKKILETLETTVSQITFRTYISTLSPVDLDGTKIVLKTDNELYASSVSKLSDKIKEAIAILYASANVLVSRKRMKNDEVKNVAEIKNELRRWNDVIDDLMKLEESGALTPASETDSTETSMSAADLEKLSKSNRAFTV